MAATFFFYDLETSGLSARDDRVMQFAGIRTDMELNPIGEPYNLLVALNDDTLPSPDALMVTGISPQKTIDEGYTEAQFAKILVEEIFTPDTIAVGFNSIRFDDEFVRHLLWRNFYDPYEWCWKDGRSRWDLLDVVRMAYALRPDGITWPKKEDGVTPSFKLEHLSKANGLVHEAAHDALSDVRATIALARLIRQHNPKLFDFALSLHKKDRVAAELRLPATALTARPFLHVSGMFPADRGCLAVMWPLASHPTNKNEVIAWDLAHDPRELATLGADEIRLRMFSRAADLPEGTTRLPIKTLHLNKSPMVVGNVNTLTPALAQRWGMDLAQAAQHADMARALPDMSGIWPAVFARPAEPAPDVDQDLYGGFVGNSDRRHLNDLRTLSGAKLATARTGFDDPRLAELVWRYRARNFPDTLSPEEAERWEAHRAACLFDGAGGARTVEQLFTEIDQISETADDDRTQEILGALYDYAEHIAPER